MRLPEPQEPRLTATVLCLWRFCFSKTCYGLEWGLLQSHLLAVTKGLSFLINEIGIILLPFMAVMESNEIIYINALRIRKYFINIRWGQWQEKEIGSCLYDKIRHKIPFQPLLSWGQGQGCSKELPRANAHGDLLHLGKLRHSPLRPPQFYPFILVLEARGQHVFLKKWIWLHLFRQ